MDIISLLLFVCMVASLTLLCFFFCWVHAVAQRLPPVVKVDSYEYYQLRLQHERYVAQGELHSFTGNEPEAMAELSDVPGESITVHHSARAITQLLEVT